VLSSTPGNAKPIFRTVSKLIVLFGMGDCDYLQEERTFQDGLLRQIFSLKMWRRERRERDTHDPRCGRTDGARLC
jgi:hypothetical protein